MLIPPISLLFQIHPDPKIDLLADYFFYQPWDNFIHQTELCAEEDVLQKSQGFLEL